MTSPVSDPPRRTQRERTERMRAILIAVGREVFARDGYANASLNSVVDTAGVTKGALYHHFDGKRDLFLAVYEAELARLTEAVTAAYRRETDPWEAFHAGVRAYLEELLDPKTQRIVLLDAPSALGWPAMRGMSALDSPALIENGLRRAMDAQILPARPAEPLAHLIFGAICESATVIANADDQRAAFQRMLDELRTLLDALVGRHDTAPGRPSSAPDR